MVAEAVPAPPVPVPYVVTTIKSIGSGLWQLAIVTPEAQECIVVMRLSDLTLANVMLSVEAVGMLANTHNGASPVLHIPR